MQEIKDKQERSVQNGKKRFWILWTETMDCVVEVRAKTKKEALELFYKDDDQIWESLECGQSERISRPFVEEVKT